MQEHRAWWEWGLMIAFALAMLWLDVWFLREGMTG